jgi:branched-chain amino acid transport system substrate-binding protein
MTMERSRRPRRRRNRMMTWTAVVVLAAAIVCAIAAGSAFAATKPTTVKIGVVLPLSGSSATAGQAAEHGAQLAVGQANTGKLVPGMTFGVVAASDTGAGGTPSGASGAAAIKGLIANGQIAGVVAPSNTVAALTELPLANHALLAAVSPSATDTCLTITAALGCTGTASELSTVQPTGRTTFFRVAPVDALQGVALADFLFTTGGYKTAYVIDDGSSSAGAQATTFINGWRLDSGSLTGHVSVPPATDYLNLLTTIAALKPDVVVYTGADQEEGITLRKQMLSVPGLSNTAFAATSGLHTSAFIQATGNVGGQVWAVAPEPQLARLPSAASFTTAYRAKFGAASTDAARGYDGARALLLAIKAAVAGGAKPPAAAGSPATGFRAAVIAALTHTVFAGADGPVAFASDGDLQQGPVEVDRLGTGGGAAAWTPAAVEQVAEPAPTATLSPSPLDFGWASTQSSSELRVQLANTGIVPFGVRSVSVSGSGFELAGTGCSTVNVLPSARCAITIRFTPGTAAKFTGTLRVVDTSGRTLQTATLSGTGVKPLALPAAVYVGNGANSSVRSFRLPLTASEAPASTLAGPDTQLDGTAAVALDAFGDLYVVNADSESVTVYRGDATDDMRPFAVLSGTDTGIANPTAIAVDGHGRLYVANEAAGTVTVYPPGASGDAAPIRTITGLTGPSGLAVDASGNVWVANSPANSLERFSPSATKPSATISGGSTKLDGPQSVTLDAAGNVLVADEYSSAITAFAPSDNGDMAPSYSISGAATQLDFPVGLDVDAAGNLYVSNFFGNTITVYSAATRNNTAPTVTLSGGTTGLAAPEHLAVTPPLAILTHVLPAARADQRYSTGLVATFGVGAYHWTIQSGHLPRGLQLNGQTGVLAGTPHRAGAFRVRVKVTDRSHPTTVAIRSLALVVRPARQ